MGGVDSGLAHAHLLSTDPSHNLHPSGSPICISLAGGLRKNKSSSLGAILVSSLQGEVIGEVQCQAPGQQPPTPACVIRKAIRSNHTLLANYCLSQRAPLRTKPGLETYLRSIMSSTFVSPRIHQMFPQFT